MVYRVRLVTKVIFEATVESDDEDTAQRIAIQRLNNGDFVDFIDSSVETEIVGRE